MLTKKQKKVIDDALKVIVKKYRRTFKLLAKDD